MKKRMEGGAVFGLLAAAALLACVALAPAAAHACFTDVSIGPMVPHAGSSLIVNQGDTGDYDVTVANEDLGSGCSVTVSFYSFTLSGGGKPSPTCMTVTPTPASPNTATLAPGADHTFTVHVVTAGADSGLCGTYPFGTPAHAYTLRSQAKVGSTIVQTRDNAFDVLDPWGNTCAL